LRLTTSDTGRVRPLLLLDVDGVLMPLGSSVPRGFERHTTDTTDIVVSSAHGVWLRELSDWYEIVWASAWGDRANSTFGAFFGLPHLQSVDLVGIPRAGTRKLARVVEYAGDRPLAWIDDELYEDAEDWAVTRAAPTMLIRTAPYVGLTERDVDRLRLFGAATVTP
jgi:hypothetical protein